MNPPADLHTQRLILVAATPAHVRAELDAPDRLGPLLGCRVPPDWPPGEYDREAMAFFLARLEEGGSAAAGWYAWYALCREDRGECRLVGAGGYCGPPAASGDVEVGYSVLPRWRNRGYAAEMLLALVGRAFGFPGVRRVIARTDAGNAASIRVLAKAGFAAAPEAEDSGLLLFARSRPGPGGLRA
ncbi:MAG: GNAT family N-acetyltransferase [Desulfovibrionaceae bacterium]|jgi:RimJ/RimL family protein N-acetyltransferase|nr:GNAT family N-acetyltransferase [Desulfovibrionaceae bacterium]